jgi:iron-sulfur cluster repair protein YtfE (RIC family)
MEIYDLLREDHARMLARVRRLASQPRNGSELEALKSQFEFHDLFEREVLYPAIMTAPGGAAATEQAMAEHEQLEAAIEALTVPPADGAADIGWREQMSDIARSLEAHITREEGPLFDLAHGSISAGDAADMAEKYRAARRKLLDAPM